MDFIKDEEDSIFILKGYAGTGKTTMLRHIVPAIEKLGKKAMLMAPTGRAAKMLREKSGFGAQTIHKCIYSSKDFSVVCHDKDGKVIPVATVEKEGMKSHGVDEIHYYFDIKKVEEPYGPNQLVIIVDEASMVGSRKTSGELLHFGTDVLLDDLLTYANTCKGTKIIFVGDPAQLPPVGDNVSAALDQSYFMAKRIGVRSYTLTEVLRQDGESAILNNAMKVRNLLNSTERNELTFDIKQGDVEQITQAETIDKFIEQQPLPEIGKAIVVCFSNARVKEYNDHIRERYYPGEKSIVAGDVLQVVRNNYFFQETLYNGDFVKVLSIDGPIATHTAPVWVQRGGKRERVHISIDFVPLTILTESGTEIKCCIIDNLLKSPEAALSPEQNTALFVDYLIRKRQLSKELGIDKLTSDMLGDLYLNAVHAKFGYAITGHKSQGGEWHTAFVDYTGRKGLDNESLRWVYTATTRASHMLYGVNMPNVTPLSRLKFNQITRLSSPLPGALSYADVECPLMPNAQSFQKIKCNAIGKELTKSNCKISSIRQMQYADRYEIITPEGPITVDLRYNKDGIYTGHNMLQRNDYSQVVLDAIDSKFDAEYKVDYQPSTESLRKLDSKVTSLCDELGITITNVLCRDWNVTYCLITSGKFSHIQFFYNAKGFITHGMPASDLGGEDEKLSELIKRLS